MSIDVNSSSNKELLWDLMYENGTFNGISETKIIDVKNLFESVVQKIDNNSNDSITEKNKMILLTMIEEVKKIKSVVLVTADDISKDRRETFDRNLNARQNELKEMLKIKAPKKVDFSDKNDYPISGSMDELLSNVISRREQDINNVFHDNHLKHTQENKNNEGKSEKKTIKIGDSLLSSQLDDVEVLFELPLPSNKDKQHTQTQTHIQTPTQTQIQKEIDKLMKLLEVINCKQDIILEKLKADNH